MEMNLRDFLDKIKHYNPELYIAENEEVSIKAVKFIEKNQSLFEPNYLYIGKSSNIPKTIPPSAAINILCIGNGNLQAKYKKNSMINLIILNNDIDIFTIFNEMQEILISHQQFAANSAKLLDSLISGKGIEHIVNVGCEILGNPICILDLSFKLIASSKNIEVDDPIWIELLTKGYCSYEFVPMANIQKFIEVVHKSSSPIFMGKDKFRIPRIISNIKVANKIVGYITSLECEKPFTRSDIDLIFLLCKVVSSEMQKSKFVQNIKGLRYENFIMDLLCGKDLDKKAIEERLSFLDLHFQNNLYVFVATVPQNNFVNISLHRIRDTIEYTLVNSKSIIYNDSVVVLISSNNKLSFDKDAFKKLTDFFKKNNIYGGLSRCFHDLADIKKFYQQSIKSIELGIHLKINNFIFFYEDLSVYHLLEVCSKQDNLKNFCHDSIFNLIEYDKKNNTDYVNSLYTYLINEKSQLETANVLNVCRSTLANRIDKIQNIMGISLNDAIITFRLILTFIILQYIDDPKSIDKLNIYKKLYEHGGTIND